MKRIITAIGNQKINLKFDGVFNIIGRDIQYKEGILEFLEKNSNVDIIFINPQIPGEISLEELVDRIEKINSCIKIHILFENKENKKLENLREKYKNNVLKKEEIEKIIFDIKNENKIEDKKIANESENKKIINQKIFLSKIKNFENIILIKKISKNILSKTKIINKNILLKIKIIRKKFLSKTRILSYKNYKRIKNKNKIDFKIKKDRYNQREKEKSKVTKISNYVNNRDNRIHTKQIKGKMISMCGSAGVGKSINIILFANCLVRLGKKVLIIDFDFYNESIKIILENRCAKKNYFFDNKIEIIKCNKNLYYLNGKNLIEKNFEKINLLKNKFDFIFIENDFYKIKKYFKEIDYNIFLVEPNLIEIKKAKKLLEEIEYNLEIKNLYIIFNKVCETSVNKIILKQIFYKYNLIGEIKYDNKYNLIINKNNNYNYKNYNQYENIMKKIINKIKEE